MKAHTYRDGNCLRAVTLSPSPVILAALKHALEIATALQTGGYRQILDGRPARGTVILDSATGTPFERQISDVMYDASKANGTRIVLSCKDESSSICIGPLSVQELQREIAAIERPAET